jgi:glucose/arabinose dehydrogenase
MLRLRSLALASIVLVLLGCAGEKADETGGSAVSTGGSPSSTTPEESRELALKEVVSGLDSPLFATAAPGEPNRLYVVEQPGRIRVLQDGRLEQKPFLDIVGLVTSGGEQGLLSVAFHPDYAQNRLFYVDYTDLAGDTRVVEYRAGGSSPRKVRELLFVDQPYVNHNGGQLQFGPDGLLYVGMGDGGAGGDPENRAQDLSERLGKLLRLDVDRPGAEWELIAYGLRNPWRFSFDRENGDLYIGDVGQGAWEEIDYLPAEARGLVNFGWDAFEGNHVYEDKEPNGAGRLVGPIAEYSHDDGCSVTGGYVYRGEAVPAARGHYFYGDYCSGTVWTLEVSGGEASRPRHEPFTVGALASFGEDSGGELYLVSLDGAVYRLAER